MEPSAALLFLTGHSPRAAESGSLDTFLTWVVMVTNSCGGGGGCSRCVPPYDATDSSKEIDNESGIPQESRITRCQCKSPGRNTHTNSHVTMVGRWVGVWWVQWVHRLLRNGCCATRSDGTCVCGGAEKEGGECLEPRLTPENGRL